MEWREFKRKLIAYMTKYEIPKEWQFLGGFRGNVRCDFCGKEVSSYFSHYRAVNLLTEQEKISCSECEGKLLGFVRSSKDLKELGVKYPYKLKFHKNIKNTIGYPTTDGVFNEFYRGLSGKPNRFERVNIHSHSCFCSEEWIKKMYERGGDE